MGSIKVCGVHPEAQFIAKLINESLKRQKDWTLAIKKIKDFEFFIEKYQLNNKKSLSEIQEDAREIIRKSLKIIDPKSKDFRGVFVFPEKIDDRYLSEAFLYNWFGALVGDIYTQETNKCCTSWYYPQSGKFTRKHCKINSKIVEMNIMITKKK